MTRLFLCLNILAMLPIFGLSCARPSDQLIPIDVVPHIQSFEVTLNIEVHDVDIVFVDKLPNPGMMGFCTLPAKKIYLSRQWWAHLPQETKESLIWHELGHCKLGIMHDDSEDEQGRANSLMHTYMPPPYVYKAKKQQYIDDLKLKLKQKRGEL